MIRIGPAGWSYKDWEGVVYPLPRPKGFHEATFLAQYFDTIEINSTFHRPPDPWVAQNWVRRVVANPRFPVHRQALSRVYARAERECG